MSHYPTINDELKPTPAKIKKANFLCSQKEIELTKNHFSPYFGKSLLPGMYCMPVYAILKPHSPDLQLITDQSYSQFSLNSMVDYNQVIGYPLDNMALFGGMLLELEKKEPGRRCIVWKSDISEAYKMIPIHPFWQIKQINSINGEFYVNRCNAFGGCASGSISIAFNSLVVWIAKNIKGLKYIANYIDNSSGCGFADELEYYTSSETFYPKDQLILL